jgi:murein DD-endopeptidase MepM/ murein hydrolase activator NlpD
LKKITITLLILLFVFSCKEKQEEKPLVIKNKPIENKYGFGFHLNDFTVINDTLKEDDNFLKIIQKQNLFGKDSINFVKIIRDTFDVKMMQKGKPYLLLLSKDSLRKLQVLVYQANQLNYYVVDFRDSIVQAHKRTNPISYKQRTVAGQLDGSLAESLKNEGVATSLSPQIIEIYKWSIDFFKTKRGDKFALTFTERFIDDTIYNGVDSLKAAFFEYKGKKIYAFPYKMPGEKSTTEFYDDKGDALKNFFLKAPLKSINITSKFSLHRFHPVQFLWKAHKGTDYAAPKGTPIMATANGVVEQAGFTAGNGNFVKIKHNSTFSTQYLHMSRILVRRNQQITQGQIIGKVGSTGLATGPHVCYRFWKNGVQVDALKLKLPNSVPMNPKQKPAFNIFMTPLKQKLDSVAGIN